MTPIAWARIGSAVEAYAAKGYTPIDTPWIVQAAAMNVTKPVASRALQCQFDGEAVGAIGNLVASAEQGFLQLMALGRLPAGRYVSCGPCFRDEIDDETHRQYFMKVELAEISSTQIHDRLERMILDARRVFETFLRNAGGDPNAVRLLKTDAGYDLVAGGLEIGSYGVRDLPTRFKTTPDDVYIYGTGLAEPRFDMALDRLVEGRSPQ